MSRATLLKFQLMNLANKVVERHPGRQRYIELRQPALSKMTQPTEEHPVAFLREDIDDNFANLGVYQNPALAVGLTLVAFWSDINNFVWVCSALLELQPWKPLCNRK